MGEGGGGNSKTISSDPKNRWWANGTEIPICNDLDRHPQWIAWEDRRRRRNTRETGTNFNLISGIRFDAVDETETQQQHYHPVVLVLGCWAKWVNERGMEAVVLVLVGLSTIDREMCASVGVAKGGIYSEIPPLWRKV